MVNSNYLITLKGEKKYFLNKILTKKSLKKSDFLKLNKIVVKIVKGSF